MKVLLPSVYYLPDVIGGIEFYIHNLATALLKRGYDVKVVTPVFDDEKLVPYSYQGVPVLPYKTYRAQNRFQFAGIQPNESLENFKHLLATEKPDLVHFNQFTNSAGISIEHIIAAKKMGVKIVYTNHMSEFICHRGDFRRLGIMECDGIVRVEKCTECLLVQKGKSKPIATSLAKADSMLATITGKNNFYAQLRPFVFPGFNMRLHLHRINAILANADAFISIANWLTNLLKANSLYNDRCITIPIAIPLTRNTSVATISKYDGKRPLKILYVARLKKVKGADILIEAVKKIPSGLVELNIYGPEETSGGSDTEYYQYCRELAKGSPNIFFNGVADNAQVTEIMLSNDVLCIPSRGNETAPLVIQEAMHAKLPVIGSSLPAIKDWVEDGLNGFVFISEDINMLAEKIRQIISSPLLLDTFKNNLKAAGDFEMMIDSYDTLYTSLFN